LIASHAAFGQVSLTRWHAPFLTSGQITALAGTEETAASLVSQSVAEYVRIKPSTTIMVVGAQIPAKWLPAIRGVRFLRLSDDEARTHLEQCGRLLFINRFGLGTSDRATVEIGEGGDCTQSGFDLRFHRSPDGWHLDDEVHGGFGGGVSDCHCR